MPPFRRARPPLVRQRANFTCWAAALESWVRASYPAMQFDQEGAVAQFAAWQNADGSLTREGLDAIARRFAMRTEITTGAALTGRYLSDRLQSGPVLLVYRPHPGPVDGHVVVAYGVNDTAVDLMDPCAGYVSKPLEFLSSRVWAMAGWPAWGVGALRPAARSG